MTISSIRCSGGQCILTTNLEPLGKGYRSWDGVRHGGSTEFTVEANTQKYWFIVELANLDTRDYHE